MSRRRPTHQRLWSSLSIATSAMDLYLVPPLLMGLKQARGIRCALAIARSIDWSVGIGCTQK